MRTKIICSIGPSTESEKKIHELIENGMDIARINLSHSDIITHTKRIRLIGKVAASLNKKIKILCDLQGPKIRIGDYPGLPRKLIDNQKITLTTNGCKKILKEEIVVIDPYLHNDLRPKDIILIDDGQIELIVHKTSNHKIFCKVIRGGVLYPKKGVNVPLTKTTTTSLTNKDISDLENILPLQPDWIGLSFVQNTDDIIKLRKIIKSAKTKIMCKIERAEALRELDEIIKEADAIMVARGDLGAEIPLEKLPLIQKQIIKKCNYIDRPVVTATHLLASMTNSSFPTRAEVTDIANAIIDGTDAVMLSNETTIGQYPIESLKILVKVIQETEKYLYSRPNKL